MKSIGRIVAFAFFLAVGVFPARAGEDVSSLPGWSSDFVAATNLAIQGHVPLVLLWGNRGCDHCQELERDVQRDAFSSWREQSDYQFCFVLGSLGKDPTGAKGARQFAGTANGTKSVPSSYPYVCVYWKKADGTVSTTSFTTEKASTIRSYAERYFAGYQFRPDYVGGDLAFSSDYDNARLEAEVGTTQYVDVPLVRSADAVGFVGTNVFTAVYGDKALVDQTVVWDANQSTRNVRVAIPGDAVAGGNIAVSLRDENGEPRGSVGIHLVGEKENSTKNPFFVGEKTVDELGYGEWTMDLDVAMAKYKKEPDSHLMAVASGSLWCPDCVMTDGHVLETDDFKGWAVDNKVILVDIDVPNFPNTTNSACLLTRVVGRTSDGYISGRGTMATNELERYQSGAGYLSRHMVSDADAAKVLERNRSLVGRNTLNGGWNNPARANQNRTGIPNFFALDRNGVLVGTFETFDAIGPSEFKEAYLSRFSELIALEDSASGDFSDRCWQTTKATYAGVGKVSGATLSALDLVDVYKLSSTTDAAALQTVSVSGSDAGTVVSVSLLAVIDGQMRTLAKSTGRLADGVSVSTAIASAGDYYVSVEGEASGTLAVDSKSASTVTAYSLEGSREKIDNPFSNKWISTATTTTLPLYSADGGSLEGTLALTLKKTKKITAKFSNGKKSLAAFSGKWDDAIAVDGTATATLKKGNYTLALVLAGDGVISAVVSYGTNILASDDCALAESYADFVGTYTVALPPVGETSSTQAPVGASFMTLTMSSTSSAKKSGKVKYVVYLSDGKKLSGTTNVTGLDANFGIVPVLKVSGVERFSAVVKVRRNAGSALSRRAVVALEGVAARWTNTTAGRSFEQNCGVYGSFYDKNDSLLDMSGVSALSWLVDASLAADSGTYGALIDVAGDGAQINVSAKKLALAGKVSGFTFKFNRSTGIFSGKTALSFEKKASLAATYKGVVLPGWFSDCDCGEDLDSVIEIESMPFGLGYVLFTDKVNRKSAKRSFAIGLDSLQ